MNAWRHQYSKRIRSSFGRAKSNITPGLLLTDCESVADLSLLSCAGALDTANKLYGDASIKLTKNADSVGYFNADAVCVKDLSGYKSLRFRFYAASVANIASISALFFTTTPFDYGVNFVVYVSSLVDGWNTINVAFSGFTATGAASWATVKGLRFTINLNVDNATEVVNFDRIEIL